MSSENKPGDGYFTSMLKDVWESMFTSGINTGVIRAMNLSFLFLFLCLAFFAYVSEFNIHVCALNLISYALFATIQWFLVELKKAELAEKKALDGGSASKPVPDNSTSKDARPRSRTKKME